MKLLNYKILVNCLKKKQIKNDHRIKLTSQVIFLLRREEKNQKATKFFEVKENDR